MAELASNASDIGQYFWLIWPGLRQAHSELASIAGRIGHYCRTTFFGYNFFIDKKDNLASDWPEILANLVSKANSQAILAN